MSVFLKFRIRKKMIMDAVNGAGPMRLTWVDKDTFECWLSDGTTLVLHRIAQVRTGISAA